VSAVTKATKEIEAKISDDVWSRQKHWEMKREVVFDASRKIARIDDMLPSLFVVWLNNFEAEKRGDTSYLRKPFDIVSDYTTSANELDQAATLVGLVCGKEAKISVQGFAGYTRSVARK